MRLIASAIVRNQILPGRAVLSIASPLKASPVIDRIGFAVATPCRLPSDYLQYPPRWPVGDLANEVPPPPTGRNK
jgi:hypothetical protein